MAKRSTIESDFYFVQIEIQIAKNEEQRPSKDTLERVLGEHLLYFYGMAGTFEVHVLSYDPMRHCAILCVDRSKVALLLNALTFFPPNDKYKSNISVLRTIRQSPYLHSLRSSSRDFFLQMLNL
jgi:RNase P/RNase MRP subunit POP5